MPTQNERSKYLSYLLRHKPETAKLTLDKEGWCVVEQLLANTDFTYDELCEIVRDDKKGRYSFAPEFGTVVGLKYELIRANQGHSTSEVRMTYKTAVPPVVLYHGTTAAAVIEKEGLKPMNRHHVHLTDSLDTARSVGGRRKGTTTIFEIDARRMLADGHKFFISENNVWLVEFVSPQYIKVHT
jgi:putative RNA 2'-phosphotransferase